ncbi:MAG TPA: hypothetical protein VK084_04730, partial [Chitinophagaceae bacterium]|nr:hypothetical protein [Chitinophagaceae bacterium]
NAVASLKAGAAGLSCIQGNYFPELIVWLCNHYDDKDSAVKVQDFFLRNMHVMHFVYPVVAKFFLQHRGFEINTFSRRQVGVFTNETGIALLKLQHEYEELLVHLDIVC